LWKAVSAGVVGVPAYMATSIIDADVQFDLDSTRPAVRPRFPVMEGVGVEGVLDSPSLRQGDDRKRTTATKGAATA
jgi:hypothetical protein